MNYHNGELAFDNNNSVIDCLVHSTLLESKLDENTCKLLVPPAARLLKPIKGLDKAQNACAGVGNLVAWRVVHIKDLICVEFPVEIGTLDVNLVHLHAEAIRHRNDGACGCKFGYRCIGVVIVDTADLAETLGDETGLVSDNIACGILLCLENPF